MKTAIYRGDAGTVETSDEEAASYLQKPFGEERRGAGNIASS